MESKKKQLKMYFLPSFPIRTATLSKEFSVSRYQNVTDAREWIRCCGDGLVTDDGTLAPFETFLLRRVPNGLRLEEDVFFIDYEGKHIGTVTAYRHSDDGSGDIHMVAICPEFRGRGLSAVLTQIALEHLISLGVPYIHLTTDEWRKAAVKGYLSAGFLPVNYDADMKDRWELLLGELGLGSVEMLNDDCSFCCMLQPKTAEKNAQ